MKTRLPFVFCLVLGCGEAPQALAPPISQSGSRLIHRVVQSEAGAERFIHFVDRQTQEPCRLHFEVTDDKTLAYCLPAQAGQRVFTDAECTQAALQTSSVDHRWVTAADFHGVARPRGFKLGARLAPPEQLYSTYGNSDCNLWGLSALEQPVYEIIEERDLSDWPRGELVTKSESPQLTSTRFVGDDGSKILWSLRDERSTLPCRPSTTQAGGRCVPQFDAEPVVHSGLLSADCGTLYVAEYSLSRMAPLNAPDGEIQLITALTRDTEVAIAGHGDCIALDSFQLGRKTLYELEPYPAVEWPGLTIKYGGEGTVRTVEASLEGRRMTPAGQQPVLQMFHIANQQSECGPSWVDGSLRCVPDVGQFENWFFEVYVDDACTKRGVSVRRDMPAPEFVRINLGVAPPADASLPIIEMYRTGAKTNSIGYVFNGDTCAPRALGDVYALGDRVEASAFAALRLIDRTAQ